MENGWSMASAKGFWREKKTSTSFRAAAAPYKLEPCKTTCKPSTTKTRPSSLPMKTCSWNVNGLRAVLKKNALQTFLADYAPDILCLQEIKCKPDQIDFDFSTLGYDLLCNPAEKPGYSGTAFLIKRDFSVEGVYPNCGGPKKEVDVFVGEQIGEISAERGWLRWGDPQEKSLIFNGGNCGDRTPVVPDLPDNVVNQEGRLFRLELPTFHLVNVYVPNSKPDLSRLPLRHDFWDPALKDYLKTLAKDKPVVVCGDFNAAHQEIDLARPKTNHHSAGFTNEERQGITNLLSAGFVDTFREIYPDVARYTWWSHWGKSRENNVGWRIDYFFISNSLLKNLKSAEIHEQVLGSDHCPVSIELDFKASEQL